jgi:hypothetical protein
MTTRLLFAELRRALRTVAATSRDHLMTWNNEWKHKRYDRPTPAMPPAQLQDKAPMARPLAASAPREESIAAS